VGGGGGGGGGGWAPGGWVCWGGGFLFFFSFFIVFFCRFGCGGLGGVVIVLVSWLDLALHHRLPRCNVGRPCSSPVPVSGFPVSLLAIEGNRASTIALGGEVVIDRAGRKSRPVRSIFFDARGAKPSRRNIGHGLSISLRAVPPSAVRGNPAWTLGREPFTLACGGTQFIVHSFFLQKQESKSELSEIRHESPVILAESLSE